MHWFFVLSLLLQVALAAHAYNHGRTSPWVWIILFFPLVGSALYIFLFMVPELSRSARRGRSKSERPLRRVARGPFGPAGDRPDNAIAVRSVAEIETQALRDDCPECGNYLVVEEHRADTIAGRALRVVVSRCRRCGATPVRYFEIQGAAGDAVEDDEDDDPMPSRSRH